MLSEVSVWKRGVERYRHRGTNIRPAQNLLMFINNVAYLSDQGSERLGFWRICHTRKFITLGPPLRCVSRQFYPLATILCG